MQLPRSCSAENCSNNVKSQPNLNCYILLSDETGVGVDSKYFVRHNSVWDFVLLASWPAVCKGSEFLQFCEKIQSSMYKIFTQMYLTVSIGPSHMKSSTEFIKKFFFRWWPPIFRIWTSQQKSTKQVHVISTTHHTPAILRNNSRIGNTWTQSLITNFVSFNLPQ